MGIFTWNSESESYWRRHKLSNGQYCMVEFVRWYTNRSIEYYVAFAIADKKKNLNGWFEGNKHNNITLTGTGRCGFEALTWCKNAILEFEEWVRKDPVYETKILVGGADPLRLRLYERGLSPYGYKKVKFNGEWAMMKNLGVEKNVEV